MFELNRSCIRIHIMRINLATRLLINSQKSLWKEMKILNNHISRKFPFYAKGQRNVVTQLGQSFESNWHVTSILVPVEPSDNSAREREKTAQLVISADADHQPQKIPSNKVPLFSAKESFKVSNFEISTTRSFNLFVDTSHRRSIFMVHFQDD